MLYTVTVHLLQLYDISKTVSVRFQSLGLLSLLRQRTVQAVCRFGPAYGLA